MKCKMTIKPVSIPGWRAELKNEDGEVIGEVLALPSFTSQSPFGETIPVEGQGSRDVEEFFYNLHGIAMERFIAFTGNRENLGQGYEYELDTG